MIRIEHLSKSFGPVRAVQDLCLDIPRGELFCFLGPNGAGKTTTIKLLAGLLRPDSGRIAIGGFDLAREPTAAKRIMGYIPDTPFLYERLTPVEFLRFIGDLYAVAPARVEEAATVTLAEFGLDGQRRALIGDLSHGMRQRLIYVSLFMHDPQVVFIDEPLVGLDPHSIRMIKDLLRAKARAGMTIFLTTHILAVAEEIADRIGILANGTLVALGRMHELRTQTGLAGRLEDVFLKLTEEG
jgi:ABC-2 type transport system ATP-binding protein